MDGLVVDRTSRLHALNGCLYAGCPGPGNCEPRLSRLARIFCGFWDRLFQPCSRRLGDYGRGSTVLAKPEEISQFLEFPDRGAWRVFIQSGGGVLFGNLAVSDFYLMQP